MWVRGHSRLLKVVPFESLCPVSYSPSIVTVAFVRYSASENGVTLKTGLVCSRSLEMAPFDRSHTSSY